MQYPGKLSISIRLICATALVLLAGCHSLCRSTQSATLHASWKPSTRSIARAPLLVSSRTRAERAEQAFAQAETARRSDDPQSVSLYYEAAVHSWHAIGAELRGSTADEVSPRLWQTYHSSVQGLLTESQRLNRFNGSSHLNVQCSGQRLSIPIACLGLPWDSGDISQVYLVQRCVKDKLAQYHAHDGFGVPIVAVRVKCSARNVEGDESAACLSAASERFLPDQVPFAATVVLRPAEEGAVLEFYNPLSQCRVRVASRSIALARDPSAPLEFRLQSAENTSMLGFLNPGNAAKGDGLRFVEPYQPGKIPVILIHGLLSDPTTWFDVLNDLRTQSWFNQNYQVWGFSYATGRPFITSAMVLRQQTAEAIAALDPEGQDDALQRMVLAGHSMGGLVAKLQVTHSENRIWDSLSRVSLDALRGSEKSKGELAERCFFEPLPSVSRVVFVATPHEGSTWAARGIGQVSSAMVEPASDIHAMHDDLVSKNPGAFWPEFERGVPTSIDMLEPHNRTLQAIRTLRIKQGVTLNSVIGIGRASIADGPGDGVVSAKRALQPGVVSERFVDAGHMTILRHPDTQDEFRIILREHLGR